MTLTRRGFLTSSAAVAAFAAGGLPARAEGAPARIGYNGDFWGASIAAVASDQGIFAKHGVDADIKVFTNGPIQVQALGAGSLDFGYIGPGALWLPATGKAKIIAVNDVGFSDRVIAQVGIKSIADLKGKKVAIPAGTSGDMLLRLALQKAGMAMTDLNKSTYAGEFGFLIIDPAAGDPGSYDREVLLASHTWEGEWVSMQDMKKGPPPDNGLEAMYHAATLGDRMLGHGEPVRVREGERVLFRVLNANASMGISLALPGHRFPAAPQRRRACGATSCGPAAPAPATGCSPPSSANRRRVQAARGIAP